MKRHTNQSEAGLDSFLDIITNVIGVMILIGASIAIHVQDVSVTLGTPLLRDPPSGAKALEFECADGRILLPIDYKSVEEQADEVIDRHFPNGSTWEENVELLNSQVIGDENYQVEFEYASNRAVANYFPRPNRGESTKRLFKDNSDFEQLLSQYDPTERFIYFTVREDSFSVFRKARELARRHGFRTGWDPRSSEYPIGYYIDGGSGGRRIWVQD